MNQKGTIVDRIKRRLGWSRRGHAEAGRGDVRRVAFRLMYERFREILALNDATLELIADIEELLGGQRRFSLDATARRIRKAAMDVFLMVKDLNQIAERRHKALYEALYRLNVDLETEITAVKEAGRGRFVVALADLRASDTPLVGAKMANLGELAAACGLAVPDGFAITTEAFLRFMEGDRELWEKSERLDASLETGDSQAFADACRAMQASILDTPVSADVAGAMRSAFGEHFPEAGVLVAMRSSAVGEDSAVSSHAGLYQTELNVDAAHLLDAYRAVLASTFSPMAISYRFQRGIPTRDALMAVGCVRMIQPRCAGIVFSRLPDEPEADVVMISATAGIAAGIVAGYERPETWVVTSGRIQGAGGTLLSQNEVAALIEAARRLESHFGAPQDVEWAIDSHGVLLFLQSRPMIAVHLGNEPDAVIRDRAPLLEGGYAACPGIGSGPVVLVNGEYDLVRFPEGGVLVARHSSPAYAQVMARCAAILTDVGSPTGHMSSLAREFEIPTIVGLEGATRALADGQPVTVDARARRVFDGVIPTHDSSRRFRRPLVDSPALERLRRIARFVTPLTMTDPASPDFRPDNCRSLHDVTRYVHEKVFEVMFHYGDIASADRDQSVRLQAKLPIRVEVFDVGGGIAAGTAADSSIRPEDIRSAPMRAFLEGLLDPRIRWDLPRPVSVRGFLSVLGESMTGPPPDTGQIGRLSYAIISDRYMNFSTKAGYHFSTIDTYCGRSVNKNYIHFRFSGGAADAGRRQRRIRFVSTVVAALDFTVQARGEMLVARLSKYSAEDIQSRLVSLGRLTLCARQLDMLMDCDASPDHFAQAFLSGEWHKF